MGDASEAVRPEARSCVQSCVLSRTAGDNRTAAIFRAMEGCAKRPADLESVTMNLSLILQMAADTDPDRIGLVSDGKRWSYGALYAAAKGAALAFRDARCTHVALLDESSEASAIALFG